MLKQSLTWFTLVLTLKQHGTKGKTKIPSPALLHAKPPQNLTPSIPIHNQTWPHQFLRQMPYPPLASSAPPPLPVASPSTTTSCLASSHLIPPGLRFPLPLLLDLSSSRNLVETSPLPPLAPWRPILYRYFLSFSISQFNLHLLLF